MTPLDPRYITLQREVGRYVSAGLSVAQLVGLIIGAGVQRWYVWLPVWIVGSAAIAWWLHRWSEIEYRYLSYRLDEEAIEIRSGVVWRAITNVPRSRVQHIDVSQGPLERKHGLGRLVIYTAGTEHSKVELPGLEHQTALQIRDLLLPRQSADVV